MSGGYKCAGCGQPADFITHTTVEAVSDVGRKMVDDNPLLLRGTWACCLACCTQLGDNVAAIQRAKKGALS